MFSLSQPPSSKTTTIIQQEWALFLGAFSSVLFLLFGKAWLADLSNVFWFIFITAWLSAVIMFLAFGVVRHAESLAVIFGEPLGSIILTLSAICIELLMVSAVMLIGPGKATIARDTMFAVVMVILNGMIGIALLLGGLKHREQKFNFYGANAYLAIIAPLAVLGLVLPNYTVASQGPTLSLFHAIFLSVMCIGLYSVFLLSQTSRHRNYFVEVHNGLEENGEQETAPLSASLHGILLVLNLIPIAYLAKQLAVPIEYGMDVLGAPEALGGLIVAIVFLSPEAFSTVRAALQNRLQRAINISLGTVLSTIALTTPAVLVIGLITGRSVIFGLPPVEITLLVLSFGVGMLTFSGRKTNFMQGAVHLLLFFAYLAMIFDR